MTTGEAVTLMSEVLQSIGYTVHVTQDNPNAPDVVAYKDGQALRIRFLGGPRWWLQGLAHGLIVTDVQNSQRPPG